MPMTPTEDPGAEDFARLADPFRRELTAHCYRMLGSVHDAEDLVQETYLRAWRAYDRFEGRSSLRAWLHRIATRVCLTALEGRARRPMPTGLGGPGDPDEGPVRRHETPWLEPAPDALVEAGEDDPAAVVLSRESIRLAFVAALQHLPPRQQAVLILRDVLGWRAAEVAETVGVSTAAVNSLLQRARDRIATAAPREEDVTGPSTAEQRDLLDRYMAAFEAKDVAAIVALFTDDAIWEMPPFLTWYAGRDAIARHLARVCPARPGDLRLLRISANGQPGVAQYLRDPAAGVFRPFNLQVLTLTPAGRIGHCATFLDTRLFAIFDLPQTLPARSR
ncbi:sigma-70 family RNA polymerase sigma factor [Thermomonospora catenispora]|uniref:sigma-70 family RNA polymerase sigma factor n=1 Tax=Thermomonospora catenispora TaxID=2493090 RepID=UPI00111E3446|nr:sigma-70 family RNA polymerase sigma factor [Thermomonospora catenispora]TNY38403.1 sigma-70 family RNA polymerase sigma factor [Thermomonospora catenispora]